jgi:hypothetical protein
MIGKFSEWLKSDQIDREGVGEVLFPQKPSVRWNRTPTLASETETPMPISNPTQGVIIYFYHLLKGFHSRHLRYAVLSPLYSERLNFEYLTFCI